LIKNKKILALLLTLAVVLSVFPMALAEGPVPVTLKASEPDSNGLFTLTLSVKDVEFNAFQFAFSYDTAQIEPVDSSGKKTNDFYSFGTCLQNRISTIGENLNSELGLFECGGYIIRGMSAPEEGLNLYSFTFRKIGTGNPGIKLATKNSGGPYNEAIPSGGAITEPKRGEIIESIVVIELPENWGGSTETEVVFPQPTTSPADAEQRLRNTLILQINNWAAAKNGGLVRIYPGEETAPYIKDSRTMVPLRFIGESLGATVDWDEPTKTATITFNGNIIKMTVGKTSFTYNGQTRQMDTAPEQIKSGEGFVRTMVPIRFVMEAFGKAVEWDQANRLVLITEANQPWVLGGEAEKAATIEVVDLLNNDLFKMFL